MRKIFLLLFISFFLTVSCANAKTLKFAQVADVHFLQGNKDDVSFAKDSKQFLQWAVQAINNDKDIKFTVFLGDNIDKSRKSDLEAFLKIVDNLKKPYYIVLGNHDAYKAGGITQVDYMEIVRRHNKNIKSKTATYSFSAQKGILCVVLDGTMPFMPSRHGKYEESVLNFLQKASVENSKDHIIVFQHFPVMPPKNDEESHEILDFKIYKNLLKKLNNIILISSGHYHTNKTIIDENGIIHNSNPSLFYSKRHSFNVVTIKTHKKQKPDIEIEEINLQ